VKALQKIRWKLACVVAVVGISILQCASPTKEDVRWRTSVDLPVTAQKKFYMGAMMDTLFFNKHQVNTTTSYDTIHRTGLPDSIVKNIDTTMQLINGYPTIDTATKKPKPDTVAFGFPTHDTASSVISEDSLADKTFESTFGPIPISGTPANTIPIPLAGPYVGGTAVSAPPVPVTVKYVYHVQFTNTTQNLLLTVTNNSAATTFSNVAITVGALGSSSVANLAPGATGSLTYSVGGKSIDSVVNVTVTVTPQASGVFAAGDNLSASFSMNGLTADRVVVMDSLLASFQQVFTNAYNLTDTVNVGYIDINKGHFIYSIYNYTGINLLLTVKHRNLWSSDFCIRKTPPLINVNDLAGLSKADSNLSLFDTVVNSDLIKAQTSKAYEKANLSGYRLFPEWDTVTKKSVSKVDYVVNIADIHGGRVTLSSADSLLFVIRATSFNFKEMYGYSMDEYLRNGTPSTIPVQLPWSKSVTDSLRGNFQLQKVLAKIKTNIVIPEGAFIDTMNVHYVITSITHPAVACSSNAVLLHVMKDSTYVRQVDITNVVNDFPDSVKVNVSLSIPVNTTIKAVNDLTDPTDSAYPKYIGRMIIHGIVNYDLVAPNCWVILDTASMDLGGDTLDLNKVSAMTGSVKKMTDRHATFTVDITNFTNVNLKIFALIATDSSEVGPLVDSSNAAAYIKTNQLTQLINNPTPGFVSLLKGGLLIPPRDSLHPTRNVITLTDDDLSRITNAKVTGWRWQVRFLPQYNAGTLVTTPDALLNTDWIKLNSWIHVDGVNSVDSLFSK
jgi:hypothetical protein